MIDTHMTFIDVVTVCCVDLCITLPTQAINTSVTLHQEEDGDAT